MWSLELEPEVAEWLDSLPVVEFAAVAAHVERLERQGNLLRMPASRALGAGLFELRFDLARAAWRITYYYPGGSPHRAAHRVPQATPERTNRSATRQVGHAALHQRTAHT